MPRWVVVLVLISAVVSLPAAAQDTVRTDPVRVRPGVNLLQSQRFRPDVKGWPFERAATALARLDLGVVRIDSVYPFEPAGTVLRQSPPAGPIARGQLVDTLWVAIAPRSRLVMPNVVGLMRREAVGLLADSGIRLGQVSVAFHPTAPPDQVIAQRPDPGFSFPRVNLVQAHLTLSRGPEPRDQPDTASALVRVPNLMGRDTAEATSVLADPGLGLRIVERLRRPDGTGRITGQSPRAGTSVVPGTTVDVVVAVPLSQGAGPGAEGEVPRLVPVPRVVGLSLEEATDRVQDVDLVLQAGRADGFRVWGTRVAVQSPSPPDSILAGGTVLVSVVYPVPPLVVLGGAAGLAGLGLLVFGRPRLRLRVLPGPTAVEPVGQDHGLIHSEVALRLDIETMPGEIEGPPPGHLIAREGPRDV